MKEIISFTINIPGYESATVRLAPIVPTVRDKIGAFWLEGGGCDSGDELTDATLDCDATSPVGMRVIDLCAAAWPVLGQVTESDVRAVMRNAIVRQCNTWMHG